MENNEFDQPQPAKEDPKPTGDPNLEDTGPVSIKPKLAAPSIPNQTGQISADQEPQPPSGFSETMATPVQNLPDPLPLSAPAPHPAQPKKARRQISWFLYTLFGLLCLILIAGLGAFGGYQSGIDERKAAEATSVSQRVQEQFQLSLQDMGDKNFFRARQRLEYVIQIDPNYPGVTDKLAEVMIALNTTETPTPIATPTLTPTPDTRGVDGMYSQAQQALANGEWTKAIDSALALRKTDANYHAVDLDGILFLALRNRGKDKIAKDADLEGGMYDLSQASKFGPLDVEAQGLLNWSSLYITGASFWDIDWQQAVNYFSQIAPQMPNMRDGSGMTAQERYRQALVGLADSLVQQGRPCKAVEQYQEALNMGQDPKVQAAAEDAATACGGGSPPTPGEPVPTP